MLDALRTWITQAVKFLQDTRVRECICAAIYVYEVMLCLVK